MKRFATILVFGVLASSGANASSFVTPEPMEADLGPSMVALGDAESTAKADAPSPSIVAFGTERETRPQLATPSPHPEKSAAMVADAGENAQSTFLPVSPSVLATEAAGPTIDTAQTAAIDENEAEPKRRANLEPMVIRGGIVGDAFARSVGRGNAPTRDAQNGAFERSPFANTPESERRASDAGRGSGDGEPPAIPTKERPTPDPDAVRQRTTAVPL